MNKVYNLRLETIKQMTVNIRAYMPIERSPNIKAIFLFLRYKQDYVGSDQSFCIISAL